MLGFGVGNIWLGIAFATPQPNLRPGKGFLNGDGSIGVTWGGFRSESDGIQTDGTHPYQNLRAVAPIKISVSNCGIRFSLFSDSSVKGVPKML
jgi:hypothetical protein